MPRTTLRTALPDIYENMLVLRYTGTLDNPSPDAAMLSLSITVVSRFEVKGKSISLY